MINAPGWNIDSNARDSIVHTADSPLKITSRGAGASNHELSYCNDSDSEGLIETGEDTGVFYGRLKLAAMDHDMNNDGTKETGLGGTSCKNSPFDEYAKIETGRDGGVTVNWEYNPDDNKVVTKTMTYSWSVATIEFVEDEYPTNGMVEFQLSEKDLGDMPKDKVDLNFRVWSDSDFAGIVVDASQDANYKHKNPYHFFIQDHEESNGENLRVNEGDTIYVEYVDTTLPAIGPNGEQWSISDTLDIIGTASVTTGYPYITLR